MHLSRGFSARLSAFSLLSFLLLSAGLLSSCSNGNAAAPAVTVAVSPTTATLGANGTQAFTATLANDGGAGVTWSLGTGAGALSGSSTTGVTYTAPATVAGSAPSTVTLTATSIKDATKTATATITLNPVAVTIAPLTPAAMVGGATQNFTATVTNDGATPGVNWTATAGTGTFSSTSTASGVATTFTAASPVTAATTTLTATSKSDPTKSASVSVTLTPISVNAISPLAVSLGNSATQAFTGSVANDNSASGLSWTISAGPGSLTAATLSGVTYNAPTTAISTSTTATLKATSIKDPTRSTTATITLLPISISAAPVTPVAMIGGATQAFTATLLNDGSNSGVTWTASVGSFATSTSASGVADVYTAPAVVSTANATVTATSVKDPSQTVTLTIPLTPIVVTVTSLPSITLDGNGANSYNIAATISGDGSAAGATFTVGGSGGTMSAPSVAGNSVSSVYTAPAGITTNTASRVTITSIADPTRTATVAVTLNPPMTFTTALGSLAFGSTNTVYNQSIVVSNGSGAKTFTLFSGALPAGLTLSPAGVIGGTISGAAGNYNFGVQVRDSSSNPATVNGSFGISVFATPLNITTSSLPSGNTNTAYSFQFRSTGGTGAITWSIGGGALPTGFTLSSTGLLSGTTTSPYSGSFVVVASDSAAPPVSTNGVFSLTIAGPPVGTISGNIAQATCNNAPLSGVTVSINTSPVQTTTTNSSGNFSFTGIPTGTYTLTPSIVGPTSLFSPATQSVTVTANNTTNTSFGGQLGYTVSGTVAYAGSKTGPTYVTLNNTSCNGIPNGTSISTKGAYTIRGVQPGSYNISVQMDNLGTGSFNASNPTGTATGLTVAAANVTNANVTLTDPATVTLSGPPTIQSASGFNTGALVFYSPLQNSNGIETASSYTLQWSTSATFASVTGSKVFAANGTGGATVWFVNGLTNATPYYFRATATSGGGTTASSSIYGPVTVGAPTGGATVSGAITYTGTATGPMYVGFFNGSTAAFYGQYIAAPTSAQAYTVQVPTGSGYFFVAVVDNNGDGLIDKGDFTDTNNIKGTTAITGTTTGLNATLPPGNSLVLLTTQHNRNLTNSPTDTYQLNFGVGGLVKTPVAVVVNSGPNLLTPVDIGICTTCGGGTGGFQFNANLGTAPGVGDTYSLGVTYSDGTTETLSPAVTTVLNAFTTSMLPTTGSSVSTQPTFTWTDPANASAYSYQFQLYPSTGGGSIWQIPGNNSNSNGFSSAITSIPWGVDPTGGGSTPSVGSLSLTTQYIWQIQVQDANGNSATAQVPYQP